MAVQSSGLCGKWGCHSEWRPSLKRIRRCVALRGDAPYLGVLRPWPPHHSPCGARLRRTRRQPTSRLAFQRKAGHVRLLGQYPGHRQHNANGFPKWCSTYLQETISKLRQSAISDYDAISLAGRALFVRFLGDRNLVPPVLGPVPSCSMMQHVLNEPRAGSITPLMEISSLSPMGFSTSFPKWHFTL